MNWRGFAIFVSCRRYHKLSEGKMTILSLWNFRCGYYECVATLPTINDCRSSLTSCVQTRDVTRQRRLRVVYLTELVLIYQCMYRMHSRFYKCIMYSLYNVVATFGDMHAQCHWEVAVAKKGHGRTSRRHTLCAVCIRHIFFLGLKSMLFHNPVLELNSLLRTPSVAASTIYRWRRLALSISGGGGKVAWAS